MAHPPVPSQRQYHIRPFNSSTSSIDFSAIADISALSNEHDPLTKYMTRSIAQKWTSYRAGWARYLKAELLSPEKVCWVAEDHATQEVVGWAFWRRCGSSRTAKAWQSMLGHDGWTSSLERGLLAAESIYFAWVPNTNPTAHYAHLRELMPSLGEQWPGEIFREYWKLDSLFVHPAHHRRGIGKALTQWGVERGREESVPVLVHSSPGGRLLYESMGFEVVKRMNGFDLWIPEFRDGGDGEGCWAMAWQYEGGDEVERCRRWYEEEKEKGKDEKKSGEVVVSASAISVT